VLDELEENLSIEELEDLEQNLSATDANFRSELEYNGYKHIEDEDNDEYLGNMDDVADDRKELNLADRPEDESIRAEENAVDPQENRKSV
jgi:hypothetical protein